MSKKRVVFRAGWIWEACREGLFYAIAIDAFWFASDVVYKGWDQTRESWVSDWDGKLVHFGITGSVLALWFLGTRYYREWRGPRWWD